MRSPERSGPPELLHFLAFPPRSPHPTVMVPREGRPQSASLTQVARPFPIGDDRMNIVDLIKGQLNDDVLGKLGSLIGESEDKTKAAAGAAVPGLLAILAQLASTGGGAEKLINSLRQVDTDSHGGFGDVLSGP